MTLDELRAACEQAITLQQGDKPLVAFNVPHYSSGENIRLFGKRGPLSEMIACTPTRGGTTAYWDARKALKYLERYYDKE